MSQLINYKKIKNKEKHIIFALQGMGDFIINLPLIKNYSLSEIDLTLVVSNNGSSQISNNILENKYINLIIWNEKNTRLRNFINILQELQNYKFNKAFALYPSGRRENLLLYLTRADKKFISLVPHGFFRLFQFLNHQSSFVDDIKKHCIEINSHLLDIPINKNKEIKKNFNSRDRMKIGFHIGAGNKNREWNEQYFEELIKLIKEKDNIELFFFGGKNEAKKTINLSKKFKVEKNLYINSELDSLIGILSNLDFYIGNDSGFTHLCSFLGIKTITIWAYANFYKTSSYSENNIIIKYNDSCHKKYDLSLRKNQVCNCINLIKPSQISSIFYSEINNKDLSELSFVNRVEKLSSKARVVYVN